MSESFLSGLDVPLIETVGGQEMSFPLLTEDDLATVGRAMQSEKAQQAMRGLPITAGAERQNIQAYYAENEPSLDDIAKAVWTIPGCKAVIRASVARQHGVAYHLADAGPVIKQLHRERGWRGVCLLAKELTTLWPPEQRDPQGRIPRPNDRGGSGQAPAGEGEAAAEPITTSNALSPLISPTQGQAA